MPLNVSQPLTIELPSVIGKTNASLWRYPPDWLEPLYHFYRHLEFDVNDHDDTGITWIELMFDFVATTFVFPAPDGTPTERNVFILAEHFASASRRLFNVCGKPIESLVEIDRRIASFAMLELPDAPGFRPRPILRQPEYVAVNMLNLVRANGTNKYIKLLPEIGFKLPSRPLWTPYRTGVHRRMRHKQREPCDWYRIDVLSAISVPVPTGPRVGPTAVQLALNTDWSQSELAAIQQVPPRHRTREHKRLLHNRTAKERGMHFILPFDLPLAKHVKCQWCDFSTAIGQFSRWIDKDSTTTAVCYGKVPRARAIELNGRIEVIKAANLNAAPENRHLIRILKIDDAFLKCTRCNEVIAPIGSSLFQFSRELCLASPGLTDAQKGATTASRVLRYSAAAKLLGAR